MNQMERQPHKFLKVAFDSDEQKNKLREATQKKTPPKPSRLRHFHEKVNDPEVANEADRQLEEQLNHGLRNFYAHYPLTHSHKDSGQTSRSSSSKIQDENIRRNTLCYDFQRDSLPKWTHDMDSCSPKHCGWHTSRLKDHNEEESEPPFQRQQGLTYLSDDEEVQIPSWAREININTLNETFSFADDEATATKKADKQVHTRKSTSDDYFNSLPEWVNNQGRYRDKKHFSKDNPHVEKTNNNFYMQTCSNITHLNHRKSTMEDSYNEACFNWPFEVNYITLENCNEAFTSEDFGANYSDSDDTQYSYPKMKTRDRDCTLRNYGKVNTELIKGKIDRNTSDACTSSANPSVPKKTLRATAEPVKSPPNSRYNRKKSTSDCKGQEFISSLRKNPIEAFDKLMFYLMTPGAVDEEDITGVETFDEYDGKPLSLSEGDNFLAFVKEKHLQQGIKFCNIASEQTIKQFICDMKTKQAQKQQDIKTKLREQVMNSAQTNTVKEIHEQDEQIEVIGYVGCTGYNAPTTEAKECNQGDFPQDVKSGQQEFEDIN